MRFEPTPMPVVEEMLWLGRVNEDDVLYDLGCGDGRVCIEAASLGARAVGVDVDLGRLQAAVRNAERAGVADRVRFVEADLFEVDLHEATVVTLFLSPEVNLALRPRLLEQLAVGARVVSHDHDMGDWAPLRTRFVLERFVYLWCVGQQTVRT